MKEPATLMHSIRQRLLAHFEKSALFAPDDPVMEAAIAKTHHAISLLCDNGMEVLIHVGMDTVELKGKGYELFVQTGDHVQKGQLLFRFDMQAIAAAGYTLTTPVIVTNSSRFARIEPLLSGRVTAGQQLLRAKM